MIISDNEPPLCSIYNICLYGL